MLRIFVSLRPGECYIFSRHSVLNQCMTVVLDTYLAFFTVAKRADMKVTLPLT